MSPFSSASLNARLSSLLLLSLLSFCAVSQHVVEEVINRSDVRKMKTLIKVAASAPRLSTTNGSHLIEHGSRKTSQNHVDSTRSFGSHPNRLMGTVVAPSSRVIDRKIQSNIERITNLQDRQNYGPRRAVIVKPLMRSSLTHVLAKPQNESAKKSMKSPLKEREPWNGTGHLVSSVDFPYTRRKLFDTNNIANADRSKIINVKTKNSNKIRSTTTNVRAKPIAFKSNYVSRDEFAPFSTSSKVVDSDNFATEVPEHIVPTKGFILQEWTTETPEKKSDEAGDYHNRTPSPLKKYKFTQKLRQRPRLRIRRPSELQHGEHTSSVEQALSLPQLTPFLPSESHESSGTEFYSQKRKNEEKSLSGPFGDGSEAIFGAGSVDKDESFGVNSIKTFGSGRKPSSEVDFGSESFGIVNQERSTTYSPSKKLPKTVTAVTPQIPEKKPEAAKAVIEKVKPKPEEPFVIPQNSGLRPAAPPPEFQGGFGNGNIGSSFGSRPETFQSGPLFGTSGSIGDSNTNNDVNSVDSSFFTGESALTPNNRGPTGDGYGPPLFPGAAIPPPVPAVNVGGAAAGIPPPYQIIDATQNPPTTLKPSALFNVLSKADLGFNQAMTHFERGTPMESAAIDILEVALGSQKLDSQARLLGHVDRAIGIGNLQRLQRWANTGGALDSLKEQLARFLKNFSPPEHLLPTIPPQLSHLFSSSK